MTITLAEAQHRLRTIVETRPNTIRGGKGISCMYFTAEGAPSCLIGEAFANELAELGVEYGSSINEENVAGLLEVAEWDVESDAAAYLTIAQDEQDAGFTWGAAVAKADAALESLALAV